MRRGRFISNWPWFDFSLSGSPNSELPSWLLWFCNANPQSRVLEKNTEKGNPNRAATLTWQFHMALESQWGIMQMFPIYDFLSPASTSFPILCCPPWASFKLWAFMTGACPPTLCKVPWTQMELNKYVNKSPPLKNKGEKNYHIGRADDDDTSPFLTLTHPPPCSFNSLLLLLFWPPPPSSSFSGGCCCAATHAHHLWQQPSCAKWCVTFCDCCKVHCTAKMQVLVAQQVHRIGLGVQQYPLYYWSETNDCNIQVVYAPNLKWVTGIIIIFPA